VQHNKTSNRRLIWLIPSILAFVSALPGAALARPALAPGTGILYFVNSLADGVPAFDDFCTLREAIMEAGGEATDRRPCQVYFEAGRASTRVRRAINFLNWWTAGGK
jgi:CSLREA domain-containing protein